MKSLLYAKNNFKKVIIVADDWIKPYYDENGILIMNVYDFLLTDDALEKY